MADQSRNETKITRVTFDEERGKTKMFLRLVGLPAEEQSDMASAGWSQSLDKLTESLR